MSDEELDRAVPGLDAPPMESIADWQKAQDAQEATNPALRDGQAVEALPDPPVTDPLLDTPLPPIATFDAEPPPTPTEAAEASRALRYSYRIEGLTGTGELADVYGRIRSRFGGLSALADGGGRADDRSGVRARAREDRQLLLDLLSGEGFFDATVDIAAAAQADDNGPIAIVLTAVPGQRYVLGTIAFPDAPEQPPGLVSNAFTPKPGAPIVADDIVAAEASIAVTLPENGYPFAKIGQRDILLDGAAGTGDYSLPIVPGPRSYFGAITTEGKAAFGTDHIATLRRFATGDLYDSRKVDDLRAALVATGLFSTVSVEPVASDRRAADGTAYADLLVRQEAGPPRTIAASIGYGTGEGVRAEGSWKHRNLFPPEGALTVNGVLGTQEQALGVAFSRANADRRDRNVELSLTAQHSNYDAFDAYTGRLAGTIAYVSTPIWQKTITYSYGFELLGTYEEAFDPARARRDRQFYSIAALPVQIGFDRSNDLLDPTGGFRLNLRLTPETSLGSGTRLYLRSQLDGSVYQRLSESMVLAARGRVASIAGAPRDAIPPSRRLYGGGGGSVRGFGYQQLGPRDPQNDPIGGRSLNEAAVELRYRFGNFGVVGFVDAGQVYASSLPRFNDWRFGLGVGGRFYTNFGPVRVDIATPLKRRSGESKVTVYVSLGQAF